MSRTNDILWLFSEEFLRLVFVHQPEPTPEDNSDTMHSAIEKRKLQKVSIKKRLSRRKWRQLDVFSQ